MFMENGFRLDDNESLSKKVYQQSRIHALVIEGSTSLISRCEMSIIPRACQVIDDACEPQPYIRRSALRRTITSDSRLGVKGT